MFFSMVLSQLLLASFSALPFISFSFHTVVGTYSYMQVLGRVMGGPPLLSRAYLLAEGRGETTTFSLRSTRAVLMTRLDPTWNSFKLRQPQRRLCTDISKTNEFICKV